MSVTMTYRFSFASIVHDNINTSSNTVGELASSFVAYSLCGQPSSHPHALIVPSCFSFRNIRYFNALFLSSNVMSSFLWAVMPCVV